MEPYADPVVSFRLQLRAFEEALGRFHDETHASDASASYGPLAEALWHAVTLDDRVACIWQPGGVKLPDLFWFDRVPGAEAAPGVRWVRNAVSHQWLDALVLDNRSHGRFPSRHQEWVWRDVTEIPGPRRRRRRKGYRPDHDLVARGFDAYSRLMSGRPADFALAILAECHREIAQFLEPTRAVDRSAAS